MDAAAGGVERELADRDAHAAGALVAEAEDALAVGDDDDLGAVELRIGEDLLDALPVLQAQEQPARLAEQPAEMLAAGADRRRIGDRQQLLDVAGEQRVEHRLVGVLQFAQERVALEIGGEAAQRLEPPRHLLVQRGDPRRQQAVQLEVVALLFGERGALVEEGIAEQLIAGERRHHLRRLDIDVRRTRHGFLNALHNNAESPAETIAYFLRFATRSLMLGMSFSALSPCTSALALGSSTSTAST